MVESCIMERNKEFHLYFDDDIDAIHHSYTLTKWLIDTDRNDIHTTQVVLLTTKLFDKGYRVFVHPKVGDVFEIKLGVCPCTKRLIRKTHCLYKLLIGGEFQKEGMILFD